MRDKFFLRSATVCAVCLPEAGDDVKKITFMKHLAVHGYRKYFRSFKKKKVSPCICAFNVFSVQACSPTSQNFLSEPDLAALAQHYNIDLKPDEVVVTRNFLK